MSFGLYQMRRPGVAKEKRPENPLGAIYILEHIHMKVAIIGTGRVGSTTAFCLVDNPEVTQLLLVNKTKKIAEGLKHDLIGTYPEHGEKIEIANYEDANEADIIVVTAGAFGAPSGSSLWEANKPIIEEVFSKIKPKKNAKIIVTTTPCDRIAYLIWKLTSLDYKNILGFGGQLDVNRLKYLIATDTNNFSTSLQADFIGEHGKRGIPIFRELVSNREKIIKDTRNFFGTYLAEYNASTYGTAGELAKLVSALMSHKEKTLTISYYEPKYEIFITWPCMVSKNAIKPTQLKLTSEEKTELDNLIKARKQE